MTNTTFHRQIKELVNPLRIGLDYTITNRFNIDLIDRVILRYVHNLILLDTPSDNTDDSLLYGTRNGLVYNEISYLEFTMHTCNAVAISEDEFWTRVQSLLEKNILAIDVLDDVDGYRTTGVYDDYIDGE